jgi:hypothetical protein
MDEAGWVTDASLGFMKRESNDFKSIAEVK